MGPDAATQEIAAAVGAARFEVEVIADAIKSKK